MANATRGDFVWYEHMTKDTRAGIAFYTEVMGWKTQPFTTPGDPDYVMFVSEQGPLGGITTLPPQAVAMGAPPHWMAHVVVDDVDAAAALVEKLGGKLFVGPLDVATIGRFAVISDPQGAILSVFKPSSPMTLHEVKNGEVCWRELHTTNSTAALAFYEQLFGWKLGDAMDMGPMGTYSIFDVSPGVLRHAAPPTATARATRARARGRRMAAIFSQRA